MQRNVWQRGKDTWKSWFHAYPRDAVVIFYCSCRSRGRSCGLPAHLCVRKKPPAVHPRNPNPFCPGPRSILPAVYVAVFAREELAVLGRALAEGPGGVGQLPGRLRGALAAADQRLLLAWLLSSVWGCRLTYNFWRKGGYRLSFEDYR